MQAIALVACAVTIVCWGSAGIFDKLGVKGVDPYSAVLVRMVFGTAAILVICAATDRLRPILAFEPRTFWCLAASAVLGGLVGQIGYFIAIKYAPVTQVIPITATYPVVAALLAVAFLREQPTVPKAIGILLVVIGLILVSSGNNGKKPAVDGAQPVEITASQNGPGDAPHT